MSLKSPTSLKHPFEWHLPFHYINLILLKFKDFLKENASNISFHKSMEPSIPSIPLQLNIYWSLIIKQARKWEQLGTEWNVRLSLSGTHTCSFTGKSCIHDIGVGFSITHLNPGKHCLISIVCVTLADKLELEHISILGPQGDIM